MEILMSIAMIALALVGFGLLYQSVSFFNQILKK